MFRDQGHQLLKESNIVDVISMCPPAIDRTSIVPVPIDPRWTENDEFLRHSELLDPASQRTHTFGVATTSMQRQNERVAVSHFDVGWDEQDILPLDPLKLERSLNPYCITRP
jgi:hypothetical protein